MEEDDGRAIAVRERAQAQTGSFEMNEGLLDFDAEAAKEVAFRIADTSLQGDDACSTRHRSSSPQLRRARPAPFVPRADSARRARRAPPRARAWSLLADGHGPAG